MNFTTDPQFTSPPPTSSSSSSSERIPGFWVGTPKNHVKYFTIFYLTAIFTTIIFSSFSVFIVVHQKRHKTLGSKNLISLIVSILVSHIILACELLDWSLDYSECYAAAVISQWAELSSMFWLNVFAIDIWKTTSSILGKNSYPENNQSKWFVFYSVYSWGCSAVFVAISVVVDFAESIAVQYKPGYVDDANPKCWMSTWKYVESLNIYTRGPFTILAVASFVFLFLAFVNVRKAVRIMDDRFCKRVKKRFMVYVQLTAVRDIGYIINYTPFWGSENDVFNNIVFGINKFIGLYLFILFAINIKKTKSLIINLVRRAKNNSVNSVTKSSTP